jgi:hypothetical protein
VEVTGAIFSLEHEPKLPGQEVVRLGEGETGFCHLRLDLLVG